MPYNEYITRSDAAGLIPEEVSREVISAVTNDSVALSLMRRVPMSSKISRMGVVDALPMAYWVNGDTGLKQTTKVSWGDKQLVAEEIAAIVPIPESVLDDASYDVWAQIRPLMADAVARALDAAVLFGVNKPASFPAAIVPGTPAGQVVTGSAPDSISDALGIVEGLDVPVTGIAARGTVRGALRQAYTDASVPFQGAPSEIWGYPITYPTPTAAWPAATDAIVGDWTMAILGVRQDLTYKVIDQGVITDNTGAIMFNLPQQDMVALRVVARYAYQVADLLIAGAAGPAWPFAVAKSA